MLMVRAGQSLVGTASRRKLAEQTRSIHIPRRIPPSSNATSIVHRARTFISRLITTHIQGPPVSRSVHSSPSIRQSLSLPARIALSRPLRAPCLPRPPRIPGNVTHVGLGTARNFSSGRPIFQHLVENVPVAGRAFYEVDWDVKAREEKNARVRRPKKSNRKAKLADKLAPQYEHVAMVPSSATEQELDHYFPLASVPLTTTYLQIPLAPTPTSRVPLSSTSSSPHLLPLPAMAKEHASHSKHSIRVSSLFRRLDAARVWERGASCETFGDPSGLCTILRIKFDGWSEEMVREVLGDAGKDWCTIQEIRHSQEYNASSQDSLASTPPRLFSPEPAPSLSGESVMSFVMPTLDFSSSAFPMHSATTSRSASPLFSDSDQSFSSARQLAWDDDSMSDVSSNGAALVPSTAEEWASVASSPSNQSWLCFSSDFAEAISNYPQDAFN